MKLYSYEDFKKHPKFNLSKGLCENTLNIYNLSSALDPTFFDYLIRTKLRLGYPIGVNGYLKRYGNCTSNGHKGQNLYVQMRQQNSLYVGMQDALRHNLYHKYCLWVKANNPNAVYPATIDFL